MQLGKLIEQLQELQNKHGDFVEVMVDREIQKGFCTNWRYLSVGKTEMTWFAYGDFDDKYRGRILLLTME